MNPVHFIILHIETAKSLLNHIKSMFKTQGRHPHRITEASSLPSSPQAVPKAVPTVSATTASSNAVTHGTQLWTSLRRCRKTWFDPAWCVNKLYFATGNWPIEGGRWVVWSYGCIMLYPCASICPKKWGAREGVPNHVREYDIETLEEVLTGRNV